MKKLLLYLLIFSLLITSAFAAGKMGIVMGQYGTDFAPIVKFGENEAVGMTYEDVGDVGGDLTYLTSATILEILSSDVDDTAAGSGARTVKVYSLNGGYNFQSETASLNGVTPVALSLSAIRVWRAKVVTAGASNSAEGIITIRVASAGATQAAILNGTDNNNQTLSTLFTIPDGYWGLIYSIFTECKMGDDAEVSLQIRESGSVFQTKHHFTVYQSHIHHTYPLPKKFPPRSDIRMRAKSPGGPIHLVAGYTLLLVRENKVSPFPFLED